MNYRLNNFGRRGFTLVELLLVVAIIAVLASMALAVISGAQDEARRSATEARLGQVRAMLLEKLESYEFRRLPVSLKYYQVGQTATGEFDRDEFQRVKNRILADMINTEMPRSEPGALDASLGVFPSQELKNYLQNNDVLGNKTMPDGNPAAKSLIDELARQRSMILNQLKQIAQDPNTGRSSMDRASEGLWFAIATSEIEGTTGLDSLGSSAFLDLDGDTLPSLVDAWDDEVQFAFHVSDEDGNLITNTAGQPYELGEYISVVRDMNGNFTDIPIEQIVATFQTANPL